MSNFMRSFIGLFRSRSSKKKPTKQKNQKGSNTHCPELDLVKPTETLKSYKRPKAPRNHRQPTCRQRKIQQIPEQDDVVEEESAVPLRQKSPTQAGENGVQRLSSKKNQSDFSPDRTQQEENLTKLRRNSEQEVELLTESVNVRKLVQRMSVQERPKTSDGFEALLKHQNKPNPTARLSVA